ncbi:MAG: hypothetical protein HLUCCO16_20990, partial [Phormidium sp. OSCR]
NREQGTDHLWGVADGLRPLLCNGGLGLVVEGVSRPKATPVINLI